MSLPTTSPRRLLILIATLTLIGVLPRFWGVDRIGLTHFDEGIYALTGLWISQPNGLAGIDPDISTYAPPALPTMIGLSYLTFGISDLGAVLPVLVLGVLTVPVVAWVAHRTFGPGAGVSAAALAAVSGPHVAFSRMTLTDVPFLFCWLLTLGLGARFLERPRFGRALAMGAAVGLAQLVKYNGWMTGVVIALAAGIGIVTRRGPDGRQPWRTLGLGLLGALLAAILYAPWYGFVEEHGGYARLLAHHRGYVGGPSHWFEYATIQLGEVVALSGGPLWGALAGGLSLISGMIALRFFPRNVRVWGLILSLTLALAWLPTLPWWLGLILLPWLFREERPAFRVLGVWWLLLSIMTPMYHPYARLWLPLHGAGWVLLGGIVPRLLAFGSQNEREFAGWPRSVVQGGLAACALSLIWQVMLTSPRPEPIPGLLGPTDAFRRNIDRVFPERRPYPFGLLRVVARPLATYYLGVQGHVSFTRPEGLDQLLQEAPPGDWLLIDETQLRQEGDLDASLRRLFADWEPVPGGGWVEILSPPTLLDVDPGAAFGDLRARRSHVWLLRHKPSGD